MRFTPRKTWEIGSTVVVVVAAIGMVTLYLVERNLAWSPTGSAVEEVEDWWSWASIGTRLGPDSASMVIAAFMDFQCPFCRDLAPVLDSLRAEYGEYVTIEFHHFPLAGHRNALPAAVAAECARRQGRFEEMYHLFFAQLDSVGIMGWGAFAEAAGVPDLPSFATCIQQPIQEFSRITGGLELGESLGVSGVPTIWVNGRLLSDHRLKAFRKRAKQLGF
jgi:protein-disulfide isomerase